MPPATVGEALNNEIDELRETQPKKRSRKTLMCPHQVTQKHTHQVLLKVILQGQQGQ